MLSLPSDVNVLRDYGPLKQGTQFHLGDGYSVFIGENNAGKSALLQYLFITSQEGNENDASALIQSNRSILPDSLTPNGQLIQWNAEFAQQYRKQPRYFGGNPSPDPSRIHALLMHGNLHVQLGELTAIVRELGFGEYEVGQLQAQTVSGFAVSSMGSGLRALFPILAAITNPKVTNLFIDEPEFALEARIQKRLRELFLQKAAEGKHIVVATHSHLMVNRLSVGHNYRIERAAHSGITGVKRLEDEAEMLEVSFNLLGNSPSDLFFPENFLIVEGASDQVIAERVRDLNGISPSQVKVLAATSSSQVRGLEEAIITALRPLIAKYSPYHEKVVCLIDRPGERNTKPTEKLRKDLRDRLVELDQQSLEEYLPAHIYALAGMNKQDALEQIVLAKRTGDYRGIFKIKQEISSRIAAILTREHLDSLEIITDAVQKAAGVVCKAEMSS